MIKFFLQIKACMLLHILVFAVSCNGQVRAGHTKGSSGRQDPARDESSHLMKTLGSHPAQNVHCSLQDKAGNLWFGTTGEGIYRYNGRSFKQFTVKDGVNSNCIWSVLEDKEGNLWFGTADGICRYDGKTFTRMPLHAIYTLDFNTHTAPVADADEKNEAFSLLQDKNGVIWVGTTAGVYCYNGASFSRFTDNAGVENKSGLSLKSVQCMLQDRKGNIWFGSGPMAFEGICRYDGKSLVNFKPKEEGWIRNMLEDKRGNIWFGTRHYGACRYDGTTFAYLAEWEHMGNPMLEDKAGNIWFSGGEKLNSIENEGGIWYYDGKTYKNLDTKDGLPDYSVWSMIEDRSGNIWMGTRNNGLFRYDGKTFTVFSE